MEIGTFYTIPTENLCKLLHTFRSLYDLHEMRFCPNEELNLILPDKRVCRFCLKSEPNVSFNNKAHIFPHQLGNEYLISDFECDTCNKKYAAFECDLSYFLGIGKTLFQTKGKNGVPNFQSPNDSITAKKINLFNEADGINIKRKDIEDNSIIVDHKNGTATIEYQKNPYRPFNVYKILLKIALSLIHEDEVPNYSRVIKLLNDKKKVEILKPLAKIFKTSLDFERNVTKPYVIILKKKNPLINIPTHCILLYFNNMIFQYFIPLHKDDNDFYQPNKQIQLHYCPPLSPIKFKEDDYNTSQIVDLSSSELKKDDVEIWTMKTDPRVFENLSKIDPKTGVMSKVELKDFDERDIKQIVLVPKDFIISPEKLKQNGNKLLDD